jgi:hypothetical protein
VCLCVCLRCSLLLSVCCSAALCCLLHAVCAAGCRYLKFACVGYLVCGVVCAVVCGVGGFQFLKSVVRLFI